MDDSKGFYYLKELRYGASSALPENDASVLISFRTSK